MAVRWIPLSPAHPIRLKAPLTVEPFLLPGTEQNPVFESLTLPRIQPCSLGVWLASLDEKSHANLDAALDPDSGLSNAFIRQSIIDEAQKPFSPDTIGDHRTGKCRCARV